ncbi:MAG TPA: hypothetical protein VK703_15745 [Candidatus Acidoferrales bacterium]|nr:hypothetical protein [Candidatus Acidoferrales bacterium]
MTNLRRSAYVILSQRLRAGLISGAPPVLALAVDAKVAKPLTRSMPLSRDVIMFR